MSEVTKLIEEAEREHVVNCGVEDTLACRALSALRRLTSGVPAEDVELVAHTRELADDEAEQCAQGIESLMCHASGLADALERAHAQVVAVGAARDEYHAMMVEADSMLGERRAQVERMRKQLEHLPFDYKEAYATCINGAPSYAIDGGRLASWIALVRAALSQPPVPAPAPPYRPPGVMIDAKPWKGPASELIGPSPKEYAEAVTEELRAERDAAIKERDEARAALTEQREACQRHSDDAYHNFLSHRGIERPEDTCADCHGLGIRTYGDTATWMRGRIGGQALARAVCDGCWGSGSRHEKWADLRKIGQERDALKARVEELETYSTDRNRLLVEVERLREVAAKVREELKKVSANYTHGDECGGNPEGLAHSELTCEIDEEVDPTHDVDACFLAHCDCSIGPALRALALLEPAPVERWTQEELDRAKAKAAETMREWKEAPDER